MLSQLLTIARNTFVESVRQPIYFVLIAIAGLCLVLTTWSAGFSMGMSESGEVSGDNKLLLDVGMATVFVVGVLLAAFLATAVISREIENKTVLTVVSKPVSRVTLVLG
jgi:ABC-type transport system involved in multi-copper enzyme maturation permease subunit